MGPNGLWTSLFARPPAPVWRATKPTESDTGQGAWSPGLTPQLCHCPPCNLDQGTQPAGPRPIPILSPASPGTSFRSGLRAQLCNNENVTVRVTATTDHSLGAQLRFTGAAMTLLRPPPEGWKSRDLNPMQSEPRVADHSTTQPLAEGRGGHTLATQKDRQQPPKGDGRTALPKPSLPSQEPQGWRAATAPGAPRRAAVLHGFLKFSFLLSAPCSQPLTYTS